MIDIISLYPKFLVPLVKMRREAGTPLPSRETRDIFRAFSFFDINQTKVVILGQDPYHSIDEVGSPKAWGLSFGYNPDYMGSINSSLANIIKEIGADPETFDTSLATWARQGVLLVNTSLTVELNKPMSHRNIGWQQVISDILKDLHKNTDCIFVAFGGEAQKVLKFVASDRLIATSHPCRFSYNRGKIPFRGSRWHELVNNKLRKLNHTPIQWTPNTVESSRIVSEKSTSSEKTT